MQQRLPLRNQLQRPQQTLPTQQLIFGNGTEIHKLMRQLHAYV